MNPFETPPAGPPLSVDPPPVDRPRRGRMALVAVLTAGLIGGGIAGVSQFASADQPSLAATPDEPADDTVPPPDDSTDDSNDEGGDEPDQPTPPGPADVTEGEIVIDTGDGDPIVIEFGDFDEGTVDRLTECLGLPAFDVGEFDLGEWEPGELPDFDELFEDFPFDPEDFEDLELDGHLGGMFDVDGGSVTVTGPDGVSVVDLGENGSVTITKSNGEISVETSGDATVSDLEELFGDFGSVFENFDESMFDDESFDEFLETLPNVGELAELPGFEPIDPDEVQSCIDEALGN